MSQDPGFRDMLSRADIPLYNPRRDVYPLSSIDVVITEKVWRVRDAKWNGSIIADAVKDTTSIPK